LFCFGNFNVKNELRSNRSIVENIDEILKKIHEENHVSNYDICIFS